jgi:glycosyltransferase involved in cell wall biosynthesis
MANSTVLLHDWLTGFRGGERVLEAFCELFPQAPLYTLFYQPGSASPIIENRKIVSSFLNKVPGAATHYRKLLPFFCLAAESLKIQEDCRLVFSSSHCVIKGVRKPKGAVHVSYIHSPMRYMYDQFESYFGPTAPFHQRWGARLLRQRITEWDIASNQNVDHMIANSYFVQKRIQEYYHRESTVIHPFVELADFRPLQNQPCQKEDYYLMVTAFAPNKRVDLAVDAFNELKRPLLIIGSGQQEKWLKSLAKSNVQFLGNLPREEVITRMRKARGFVFPGVEDFGITPLESLASGTPVIAYQAGGVLETLSTETAFFFNENSSKALQQAVLEFEKASFDSKILNARAEEFSKELFKEKVIKFLADIGVQ